jgi:hypothetical protein
MPAQPDLAAHLFLAEAWQALRGDPARLASASLPAGGELPSAFQVTALAQASIAAAGLALAEVIEAQGAAAPQVDVDGRLASLWFGTTLRPEDWTPPSPWDPIAGDYATRDGWIRLHTNAPHHRRAAKRVLGDHHTRDAMADAVLAWEKDALESAVVEERGCAAAMRDHAAWLLHPQGAAVQAEPLVHWDAGLPGARTSWAATPARPLHGLRVLDMTRVLAGPAASRFLAGHGAEVLRIDPPWWDEPGLVPEMTVGKRCAQLDLGVLADRERFTALLAEADVFLHGYRADALERLGVGAAWRRQQCPGLVDVSLDAYGWTGPWHDRRGFDSLVQMSSGIAEAGMRWAGAARPVPLPVQALDHATGYLMAAAVLRGLAERLRTGAGSRARLSLARTGRLLMDHPPGEARLGPIAPETSADLAVDLEQTAWGPARRLRSPLAMTGVPLRWSLPAGPLHGAPPAWATDIARTQP